MTSVEMTESGHLLNRFMRENGLSEAKVGLALNVSGPAVHGWRSGRQRPKPHLRAAIETWSNGAIPAAGWDTEGEKQALVGVKAHSSTKAVA